MIRAACGKNPKRLKIISKWVVAVGAVPTCSPRPVPDRSRRSPALPLGLYRGRAAPSLPSQEPAASGHAGCGRCRGEPRPPERWWRGLWQRNPSRRSKARSPKGGWCVRANPTLMSVLEVRGNSHLCGKGKQKATGESNCGQYSWAAELGVESPVLE